LGRKILETDLEETERTRRFDRDYTRVETVVLRSVEAVILRLVEAIILRRLRL
jgi:hypothetical protein